MVRSSQRSCRWREAIPVIHSAERSRSLSGRPCLRYSHSQLMTFRLERRGPDGPMQQVVQTIGSAVGWWKLASNGARGARWAGCSLPTAILGPCCALALAAPASFQFPHHVLPEAVDRALAGERHQRDVARL